MLVLLSVAAFALCTLSSDVEEEANGFSTFGEAGTERFLPHPYPNSATPLLLLVRVPSTRAWISSVVRMRNSVLMPCNNKSICCAHERSLQAVVLNTFYVGQS